jgi:hypothetical protein
MNENDGNIHITIKNPYSKLTTKDLLKLLASKNEDPEVLSSEDRKNIAEKIKSVEICCENCENPLSLETKLQLEKRLSDQKEDVEFKEGVLSRLDKIENMLGRIIEKLDEEPPEKRRKIASESTEASQPAKQASQLAESSDFIEYIEEDLEDSKPIVQVADLPKEDDKPDPISLHFPIKSVEEMNTFNDKLTADEVFIEDVLRYMKQLNFKISAQIWESSKYLQQLVTDDCLASYTWQGQNNKLCLKELIFFSKIIYGEFLDFLVDFTILIVESTIFISVTMGKFLAYPDFEFVMKKVIRLAHNRIASKLKKNGGNSNFDFEYLEEFE